MKFGKAREAIEHWKEGRPIFERLGMPMKGSRILTDVVGPFYTLALENTFESLSDYERASHQVMDDEAWRNWYARFTPLCEGGHRELFSVAKQL